jgi:RNA:NAD 2'-phosphotransferase (TPT1/KptA family)
MQSVSGSNVSQKTAIVMAGVSKIFVGEIVETGTCPSVRITVQHTRHSARSVQVISIKQSSNHTNALPVV